MARSFYKMASSFYDDPDRDRLSFQADSLFQSMLGYCSSYRTDGFVSDSRLRRLYGYSEEAIRELCRLDNESHNESHNEIDNEGYNAIEKAWVQKRPGGYQVRSWLAHNTSAAQQEAVRLANSQNGKSGMESRWKRGSDNETDNEGYNETVTKPITKAITKEEGRKKKVEGRIVEGRKKNEEDSDNSLPSVESVPADLDEGVTGGNALRNANNASVADAPPVLVWWDKERSPEGQIIEALRSTKHYSNLNPSRTEWEELGLYVREFVPDKKLFACELVQLAKWVGNKRSRPWQEDPHAAMFTWFSRKEAEWRKLRAARSMDAKNGKHAAPEETLQEKAARVQARLEKRLEERDANN